MPGKVFSREIEQQIVQEYTTSLPDGTWTNTYDLARKWNVSVTPVRNTLIRYGVKLRTPGESQKGKPSPLITRFPPEGESPPLCKCGCGQQVEWYRHKNRWRAYADGHFHNNEPYRNYEWLYHQYVTLNRTFDDIAKECGASRAAIGRFARKLNIPCRDISTSRMGRKAGPKNPAWKGGTTPERQRLYKAGHWKEFVKEIYARDGYVCKKCGEPKRHSKGLHAHHIKSWAGHPELRIDPLNVITLCRTCHEWVHSKANKDHEFLE